MKSKLLLDQNNQHSPTIILKTYSLEKSVDLSGPSWTEGVVNEFRAF